jgi:hypothetical protein
VGAGGTLERGAVSSLARAATARDALAAAGIPAERLGHACRERLSHAERTFYRWILRRFEAGRAPEPSALAEEAGRLELELGAALSPLAREDLVHVEGGEVVVAYPFSGRRTAHRVRLDGRDVYAMCAIDALGIAPMLGRSIEVVSRDPVGDEEVRVSVTADGRTAWQPREAVVLAGRSCEGEAFRGCCQALNFFASTASAERYVHERPEVRGFPISIPDAVEAGRLVFGEILELGAAGAR